MSTHDEDKDKWVDDLLAQLPVAMPIPKDIDRQLDQFLADHISTLDAQSGSTNVVSLKSRRSKNFANRYQFLVAAAAVVGVLTFVGTQTSIFQSGPESSQVAAEPTTQPDESQAPISPDENATDSDSGFDSASPAPAPTETKDGSSTSSNQGSSGSSGSSGKVDPEVSSSEIQVLGSEGGTEYLPSDAPNVQITQSGMDYAKNIDAILDDIAPYGEPGKLNKLSNAQLGCVVKFKLVDRVVAVDSGKFNGASVVTFFAIADDGTTKAYVTKPGNSCELVKKISIN